MKSNPTTDQMNRGDFLRSLGMSSAALMAFYCMGTTLTSCSKGSTEDPTPTPTTGTGITGNADSAAGTVNYTLNLTDANYSKLKTVGQYVIVGSTLVAKVQNGSLIALSKACTHQGTTVEYRAGSDDVYCSSHGSAFTTAGAVKVGPATKALTQYTTTLSTDGNSLTVKA